jgi:hypothetical protein
MSQFRSALLVAALGLVACGRPDAPSSPKDDTRTAPEPRGGALALPVATIEFHEGTDRVSSHEQMLVTEQETCLQTLSIAGRPAAIAATDAAALAGPRRLVRAYYNGDRMAWYEVNRMQDVDDSTCALVEQRERRVVIVRDGEVFLYEMGERGPASVERYPVETSAIAAPAELADGQVLRRVAGQDCLVDPEETLAASAGVEGCYWHRRPAIRDAGLAEVPLYTRAPGVLPDDPPTVWQAVEIIADRPPPDAAFEVPSPGRAPDPRYFPQEARVRGAP